VLALQAQAGNRAVTELVGGPAADLTVQRLDTTGSYEGNRRATMQVSDVGRVLVGRFQQRIAPPPYRRLLVRNFRLEGFQTSDSHDVATFDYQLWDEATRDPDTGRVLRAEGVLEFRKAAGSGRSIVGRMLPRGGQPYSFHLVGRQAPWARGAIEGAGARGSQEARLAEASQRRPLDEQQLAAITGFTRRVWGRLRDFFTDPADALVQMQQVQQLGGAFRSFVSAERFDSRQRPLVLRELGRRLSRNRIVIPNHDLSMWVALTLAVERVRRSGTRSEWRPELVGYLAEIAEWAPEVRAYVPEVEGGLAPERAHELHEYSGELAGFSSEELLWPRRREGPPGAPGVEGGVGVKLFIGRIRIDQTAPARFRWTRTYPIGLLGVFAGVGASVEELPFQASSTPLEPRRLRSPYVGADFVGPALAGGADASVSARRGIEFGPGEILVAMQAPFGPVAFDTGDAATFGGGYGLGLEASIMFGYIGNKPAIREAATRHLIVIAQRPREVPAAYGANVAAEQYPTDEESLSLASLARIELFCADHREALLNPRTRVKIVGYADRQWRGRPGEGARYNRFLSERRAKRVWSYIANLLPGVRTRMTWVGRGEDPAQLAGDAPGQANEEFRRTDIVLNGRVAASIR
jgi:hypothetical protein